MRHTDSPLWFLAFAPWATAFPAAIMMAAARDPEIASTTEIMAKLLAARQAGADVATTVFEPVPIFNAEAQYVDVSEGSGHEYVAPGPNDLRGPCPGLNASKHRLVLTSRADTDHSSGRPQFSASQRICNNSAIPQFLDATMNVVGMGVVLLTFLTAYGAAIDGSGLAWSIGGAPSASQAGLLPGGNGIGNSHNKYETDASPTRPDLYEAGNDYVTVADQFQQLIDASPGSVTMDSLTAFRSQRFDTQIANNPYFFNGPFSGVLVQPAAYTFIYRFMANHSEANPSGYLSYDVIKSWFGITGENGNYTANQGQERIPENWYRRAIEYPYDNTYFTADVVAAALLHPKFLSIGGNTGTTNSFTGVDVANLTDGVYNAQTLSQGDNAACLAYQVAAQAKPDVALGVLKALTNAVGNATSQLSCPQLEKIDESQLAQFPGYSRSSAAQ